jgi:hypothetical protein
MRQPFVVSIYPDWKPHLPRRIFIDEKPGWYDLAQDSPTKTGPEIIAEAKAAGFSFD